MPFLTMALIVFPLFYFTAGKNFARLWKAGLIGVGIMVAADYLGFRLNLYYYEKSVYNIAGFLPIMHIFNIFIISMLFLNWLPGNWADRALYIVYLSFISLGVEAASVQAGLLVYSRWMLLYSYFLDLAGLSLLTYLSNFVPESKAARHPLGKA